MITPNARGVLVHMQDVWSVHGFLVVQLVKMERSQENSSLFSQLENVRHARRGISVTCVTQVEEDVQNVLVDTSRRKDQLNMNAKLAVQNQTVKHVARHQMHVSSVSLIITQMELDVPLV